MNSSEDNLAYIVCSSHRAYDKVKRVIPEKLVNYYHVDLSHGHQITKIPKEFLPFVLKIKGVKETKKYNPFEWRPCVSWTSSYAEGK